MSPSAWGFVQPGTFQVPGLQLGRWKKSCQQKSRMEVMNQGFLETKLFQHWLQTWKRQILLYKIVLYDLYTWGLLDGWIARTWTSNSLLASGIYGSVVRRWSTFFCQYHYPSNSFSPCTWYQYVGFIQDSGAQMTIGWIPPQVTINFTFQWGLEHPMVLCGTKMLHSPKHIQYITTYN